MDEVQHSIKGNAAKTSHLFLLPRSDSFDLWTIRLEIRGLINVTIIITIMMALHLRKISLNFIPEHQHPLLGSD
jgi:hypothetical protein